MNMIIIIIRIMVAIIIVLVAGVEIVAVVVKEIIGNGEIHLLILHPEFWPKY